MTKLIAIAVVCCLAALVAADGYAFAQTGSTGGTLGKTDKSVSGGEEAVPRSHRKAEHRIGRRSVDGGSGIVVVSATYGGSCGASQRNQTRNLGLTCNGKRRCDYVIDYQIIGDPTPNCLKDYVAEWRCGSGQKRNATVAGEAGYRGTIALSCE
jgi:hypothetical protein